MGGERRAIELNGVDANVDEQLNAAVAQQTDGVFGLKMEATSPENGAITLPTEE
ncbi:Uncharacterised protein [Klebsiella grimontii]|uniref:Uncharacterized protein n=1 Tax=Klebsiella grimontii TaxID=2058152 RepID=A0A7H4P026_9ENTR|nr:Uncharacterised protein [Klebsiella grimontii]